MYQSQSRFRNAFVSSTTDESSVLADSCLVVFLDDAHAVRISASKMNMKCFIGYKLLIDFNLFNHPARKRCLVYFLRSAVVECDRFLFIRLDALCNDVLQELDSGIVENFKELVRVGKIDGIQGLCADNAISGYTKRRCGMTIPCFPLDQTQSTRMFATFCEWMSSACHLSQKCGFNTRSRTSLSVNNFKSFTSMSPSPSLS